jgi:hypothetical protein
MYTQVMITLGLGGVIIARFKRCHHRWLSRSGSLGSAGQDRFAQAVS